MAQITFMASFLFGCLTKSSTWLVDCWCHPCYKKDKWQGMEFVTSAINLDLFCSNQESSPAQQNMVFNMRLWLVVSSVCADTQLKNETGERMLLGSSAYNLVSEPEKELSVKVSWKGHETVWLADSPLRLFCFRAGPFVKSCLHTQEMLQRYPGKCF